MFTHVMLGSNDLPRAKKFYDACFAALGAKEGVFDPKGRLMYIRDGKVFLLTTPIDGQPASCANGMTIGFAIDTPEQGDAWHAAGIANGGTTIEDAPGIREAGDMKMYLAYLRDPDGHKICVMKRM